MRLALALEAMALIVAALVGYVIRAASAPPTKAMEEPHVAVLERIVESTLKCIRRMPDSFDLLYMRPESDPEVRVFKRFLVSKARQALALDASEDKP